MEVLKFRLSGRTALFKKPDVNSNVYFSYSCIHKIALLGIFGSILGYKGYNQMEKGDVYPEFYEKLKDLKVGIKINSEKGFINKKIQTFNNSVGYASKEQGGNHVVKEQWLENPDFDVFLLLDSDEAIKIKDSIMNYKTTFIPYLGKNDHVADISKREVLKSERVYDIRRIHSIFEKNNIILKNNRRENSLYKYEEKLPYELEKETNKYEVKSFLFTNMIVENIEQLLIYEVKKENIVFF